MREINKTYLHLKVAHLQPEEVALIVIDQPEGCEPRFDVLRDRKIVTCHDEHRMLVVEAGKVEDLKFRILSQNRPRDEHGRWISTDNEKENE